MASDVVEDGGVHAIQLVPESNGGEASLGTEVEEEIAPLLPEAQQGAPKLAIFSVSYPNNRRRTPKGSALGEVETEATFFCQSIMSRSNYSGLLSIAFSSVIYCIMEFCTDTFSGRPVPLFEEVFVRCTVISILSFLWLRSTGRPTFGPRNTRNLLLSRSITARMILKEKLTFIDIGGLICGFVGLLFIFQPKLHVQGGLSKNGDMITITGSHIYPVLVGILSSAVGGISYCLIRAAAKAADQPVSTVLAFGLLASPLSAICTFSFQEFMLPDLLSLFLMVVLSVLAFFAEVSLAHGLQLEKISKATTVQYLKVAS